MRSFWVYFCSASLLIAGLVCIKRKEIGVGIEGRPASFYIKGKYSIIIGLMLVAAGVIIFLKPDIITFMNFGPF
jgi:ascorbate-specific PTS system EIIC-type component UlaA